MSNNFGFDPKLFMKLTEINDNEFNFVKNISEINDEDLLKELEALSSPKTTNHSNPKDFSKKINSNFLDPTIQEENTSFNDLNVENIVLTPEDEQNPELLAELAALNINTDQKFIEKKEEELMPTLSETVAGLKKEILRLKQDGDIDGAKRKLQELIEFEGKSIPKTKVPKELAVLPPLKISNEISDKINNIDITTPVIDSPLKAKNSTDVQVYRELFAKLQKQSILCQSIIEFYASNSRKSEVNLFSKRKQAFDLDFQKLRMMLKNKQPAPAYKAVNVTYEFMKCNSDVPDGELQILIGKLKIILPRKFKLKTTEEYKIRLNYELSGLNEQEMILTSMPFTSQGLCNNMLGPFVFKCNKRDIRVIKSVEYKKLKIEIISESGFLFFKSSIVKMTGHCKFDKLLKECNHKEEIEIFEVEEGKKKMAIPSAKLSISGKTRGPLSGTEGGLKQITERCDLSNPVNQPDKTVQGAAEFLSSYSVPCTGTLADQIRSFEVIEYELGLLEGMNPVVLREDENLMELQVALEALRDQIQLKVELGQLSMEEYLVAVKVCISETKTLALQAKSKGNLKLAQKYVKHIDIMRKEVSEAEAASVGECE